MAIPVLIDTDMGVDDAVAVSLALASDALDVRAIVGVGGSVELDQVMTNIGALLTALMPPAMPVIGRGLDQSEPDLLDRRDVFGSDGLGNWDRVAETHLDAVDYRDVYRQAIDSAGGELTILTLGPLTNLAALIAESPDSFRSIRHITLSGGAVWVRGNVNDLMEFNFYRDPSAAAAVMSSGFHITVVPQDVSDLVCLDQSHVAHLAASGTRSGEIPAQMLEHVLSYDGEPSRGKALVHAAVAAGSMIWPDLFLKTKMRLEVDTSGKTPGQTRPGLGGDPSRRVSLLTAVNAVDFLENLLESLCHEAFIV